MRNQKCLSKLVINSALFGMSLAFAQFSTGAESTAIATTPSSSTKLSWFIPDGFRADPDLFNIFQWAKDGKLPNIKRMMESGSYGYSVPVFPSHTPANFAALLTGMYPKTNGVPDGPMRVEGQSLEKSAVGGFSSSARRVPAVWGQFGHDKRIVLLSMPGSTPPELKTNAVTIRGRWGGWGADTHSVIFEKASIEQRTKLARNSRLFMQGMELTRYLDPDPKWKWPLNGEEKNSSYLKLDLYGASVFAKLQRTKVKGGQRLTAVAFSRDGEKTEVVLKNGQWSQWFPIEIEWNGRKVTSNFKFHVISAGPEEFFRIRVLVDSMNSLNVEPPDVADAIRSDIGPMVDFPDNFPAQLVYYPDDKKTFLSEVKQSIDWHRRSVDSIYSKYHPDIFIHDIYTPNQMLTSKWWMGYVDPTSLRYRDISDRQRKQLWSEVMEMYKGIDTIVGKTLDNADQDTLIVFSSDHGAIPLDSSVQINNLFAKKGWITYAINPNTGEPSIDWLKSKVVFLKMSNIYINPNGLGPTYKRTSGPEYDALRQEVIAALDSLQDENGRKPLDQAVKWEDVESRLNLPPDRTGDLVIANRPGFGWAEDITNDGKIFVLPLESGYKQAVFAGNVRGLWAPFIIVGKGIKRDHAIQQPISNIDQLPTIFRAMNIESPRKMEGRVIDEIFVNR